MGNPLNQTIHAITGQESDNSPVNPDNSDSHQNRSGIMDNAPGKSDEIFEDANVPSEGEVENINEEDEDFDSIENDLSDTDLDDNSLEDLDNEDDVDEDDNENDEDESQV
ncbi:MAG: hypothetical protein ABI123_01065 [Ginsengibacter sp.]|jgi:hypothetical protein